MSKTKQQITNTGKDFSGIGEEEICHDCTNWSNIENTTGGHCKHLKIYTTWDDSCKDGFNPSVSHRIHTVRILCHDLANRLNEQGIEWAAIDIRCHITPILFEIAQKHCK